MNWHQIGNWALGVLCISIIGGACAGVILSENDETRRNNDNRQMVVDCIAIGGLPQYKADSHGNVEAYYGCVEIGS